MQRALLLFSLVLLLAGGFTTSAFAQESTSDQAPTPGASPSVPAQDSAPVDDAPQADTEAAQDAEPPEAPANASDSSQEIQADSPTPAAEPATDGEQAVSETAQEAAAPQTPAKPLVNFKGYLKERGNRRPIADVVIYLKGTDLSAMSDLEGYFEFEDLPPGTYNIIIPSVNFEKYETSETINPNEIVSVTYYMEPKVYGGLEVVVRGQRAKKEVSRAVIDIAEAQVIPGTQGDAVKVVETLPGVARGVSNQGLVIRGSNAEDSQVLLDGHSIPQLFHFGGFKSVYNSDFLEQIDLYTGGFGAEYGQATGGVVILKSRTMRTDRWSGYVDTSFIDVTGLVEGPITDDLGFGFAFRRSMLDLILPPLLAGNEDFDFVSLPVYYDYQFNLDWKIDKHHSLSLDWYGALDKLSLITETVSDQNPEISGQFGFRQMFHNGVITYTYENGPLKSVFSPSVSYTEISFNVGADFFFNLKALVFETYEDVSLELNKNHTLRFGLSLEPQYATVRSNLILPPKEGDVDVSFSNSEKIAADTSAWDIIAGVYIADEMKFGNLLIIPGIRFDYNKRHQTYAIGPRLKTRYQIIDEVAIKAAAGLYHRPPDPDESYEPFGNGGLEFERAVHLIAGLEWDITGILSVDVQGYYKYIDNLVNQVENPEPGGVVYTNNARGYVVGGEILLRHDFTDNFFGWISYSVSRAMRDDGPGTAYRLFDQDQTHNLSVVASYRFAKTWRIGGRFTFSSGEPYTEIAGSIFNADNGTYLPVYDSENKNNRRAPAYHRLDIRLDKDWVFNTWILTAYLDIQNVYYYSNPVAIVYNYDYSEQSEFVDLPIVPSIGIKAKF